MNQDLLFVYAEELKRLNWTKRCMDNLRNASVVILFFMVLASFGTSEPTSHRVPYFGSLVVFALFIFETRLFRQHAVNQQRVSLLEQALSVSSKMTEQNTNREAKMSQINLEPECPTFFAALAFRIYKNYFLLFLALDTSWLAKLYLSPAPAENFSAFLHRLDLGFFRGWITLIFLLLFWIVFFTAVVWVARHKQQKSYLRGD